VKKLGWGSSGSLAFLPFAGTITQVEVFEHKLAVTSGHWRIAGAARSLATDGLWSSFTPNHLIKSTAVRAGACASQTSSRKPAAGRDLLQRR
jgi:hypothetical protein